MFFTIVLSKLAKVKSNFGTTCPKAERRIAYGYNLHQALQKSGRQKRCPDHAGTV